MTIIEKQNPLKLHDKNGKILSLGIPIIAKYKQYSSKKDEHDIATCTGIISRILDNKPCVIIDTDEPVFHWNHNKTQIKKNYRLEFYHFIKQNDKWIAKQTRKYNEKEVDFFLELNK